MSGIFVDSSGARITERQATKRAKRQAAAERKDGFPWPAVNDKELELSLASIAGRK